MVRSFVCGSVGAVLCLSGAAAADIYPAYDGGLKDVPYVVAPFWSGFYGGVNGGYGWANNSQTRYNYPGVIQNNPGFPVQGVAATNVASGYSVNPEGGFGGGQIGYNFQRGGFVFGIETDIQGAGIDDKNTGTTRVDPATGCCGGDVTSLSTNVDWFGTVRGRLGYAIDRALIYGTGGFAYGGVSYTNTYSCVTGCPPAPGNSGAFRNSTTLTGWTAGGGVEYALAPGWSLKVEYQYVDLGSVSFVTPVSRSGVSQGYSQNGRADVNFNTIRVGLNYHFGQTYEPLK
jgi:outer membrane immunogenic protein